MCSLFSVSCLNFIIFLPLYSYPVFLFSIIQDKKVERRKRQKLVIRNMVVNKTIAKRGKRQEIRSKKQEAKQHIVDQTLDSMDSRIKNIIWYGRSHKIISRQDLIV